MVIDAILTMQSFTLLINEKIGPSKMKFVYIQTESSTLETHSTIKGGGEIPEYQDLRQNVHP